MPIEPSNDPRPEGARPHPPLERSRFGGAPRRPEPPVDDDAPVSREDLSKAPQELLDRPEAHINRGVLVISSARWS